MTISVSGLALTRLWHCFGTEGHRASLATIEGLLDTSGTNVLPINTHRLDATRDRSALEHGFAGVTYDALAERRDTSAYVKMLNVNLRTSVRAAVEAAKVAYDMTGEPVLKLEVLDASLRHSRDDLVVEAARQLARWDSHLVILPLLTCSVDAAKSAVDAGCPLLRVMGSPIGARRGIVDANAFEEICALSVPVVLDGGIGHPEHLQRAADLGAEGALVNSVLFEDGRDPVEVVRDYVAAARQTFGHGA